MRTLAFVLLLSLFVGCKREEAESKPTRGSAQNASVKDEEVRRVLVLEAALEKAKTELRELEAAQPRNEAAIEAKRKAIEAVTHTLANSQRRVDEMDRRSQPRPN